MNYKKFNYEKLGSNLKVTLFGIIDEDYPFKDLPMFGFGQIDLYLGEVNAINSCGIREWVRWLAQVPTDVKLNFHQCAKPIVDQINMVLGFLPNQASVESFYVPFFSAETEENKLILFNKGKEFGDKTVNAPTDIKDKAGNLMELDIIEKRYFGFILGKAS